MECASQRFNNYNVIMKFRTKSLRTPELIHQPKGPRQGHNYYGLDATQRFASIEYEWMSWHDVAAVGLTAACA